MYVMDRDFYFCLYPQTDFRVHLASYPLGLNSHRRKVTSPLATAEVYNTWNYTATFFRDGAFMLAMLAMLARLTF
jgi:hypothetical protein